MNMIRALSVAAVAAAALFLRGTGAFAAGKATCVDDDPRKLCCEWWTIDKFVDGKKDGALLENSYDKLQRRLRSAKDTNRQLCAAFKGGDCRVSYGAPYCSGTSAPNTKTAAPAPRPPGPAVAPSPSGASQVGDWISPLPTDPRQRPDVLHGGQRGTDWMRLPDGQRNGVDFRVASADRQGHASGMIPFLRNRYAERVRVKGALACRTQDGGVREMPVQVVLEPLSTSPVALPGACAILRWRFDAFDVIDADGRTMPGRTIDGRRASPFSEPDIFSPNPVPARRSSNADAMGDRG